MCKQRLVLFLAALFLSAPSYADLWDTAIDTDDNTGSDNVPIHGTVQVHDLGVRPGPVADQDFYGYEALPRTSFEAVIEGLTGDTGGSLSFQVLASDGTTILASGISLGGPSCTLCTQSLRFDNNQAIPRPVFIRVGSPGCGTSCNSSDQYTFRFYETTYSITRFNNSGTQITVLFIQNTRNYTINANVHFWNAAGTQLGTHTANIGPMALLVLNTSALGFANGTSGSMTVSNNGRYGDLNGKAVALEPATGFSFDTPMMPRPL